MEKGRSPEVNFPPLRAGIFKVSGSTSPMKVGAAQERDPRVAVHRFDEPGRLSLGRVASRQGPVEEETAVAVQHAAQVVERAPKLDIGNADKYGVAIGPQEAYVFADGVKTLAVNKGLSEPPTLGCVIAHEIGHLLLGPDSHADGGIVRADRRVRVFRLAAQGMPPTFTPAQARQLLARLR